MAAFKIIKTSNAPGAVGSYSPATQVGNLIFMSGQIGLDAKSSELVKGGFDTQLKQIFHNMEALLAACDANLTNIVKLNVYLTDLNDYPQLNKLMKNYFVEPFPARTTLQVSGLPKNAIVEIDAIVAV